MAVAWGGRRDDERLIDLIYDAAFDGDLWPDVLTGLGDRAGAGPGNLVQIDIVDGSGFGFAARTPADTVDLFFADWASRNPIGLVDDPFDYRRDWAPRINRDTDCIDRRVLERSPYWNEFLVPLGACYSIHVRLALRGNDLTTITLGRPAHCGVFEDDDIAALVPFHRHLIRAERMWRGLGAGQAAASQVDALLAASPDALFFLDDRLRLRCWTPAAEALLRRGGAVRSTGGRLHAADPTADTALQGALAVALAGGAPLPVAVTTRPDEAVTLSVARLGERAAAAIPGGRCLLVAARSVADPAATLRTTYDLTATEAQLALAIAAGDTLRTIAARHGVSINTVRNQLGAVFDKTGCGRQQDLVRLLATRG